VVSPGSRAKPGALATTAWAQERVALVADDLLGATPEASRADLDVDLYFSTVALTCGTSRVGRAPRLEAMITMPPSSCGK
jgi:hypothetical protein